MLAWNVQGFGNRRSYSHMRELLRRYKPDLVFVFEPHFQFTQAKNFCDKVRYYVVAVVEAFGHSGGVWALSREDSPYSFDMFNSMLQCVSVEVSCGGNKWLCT